MRRKDRPNSKGGFVRRPRIPLENEQVSQQRFAQGPLKYFARLLVIKISYLSYQIVPLTVVYCASAWLEDCSFDTSTADNFEEFREVIKDTTPFSKKPATMYAVRLKS